MSQLPSPNGKQRDIRSRSKFSTQDRYQSGSEDEGVLAVLSSKSWRKGKTKAKILSCLALALLLAANTIIWLHLFRPMFNRSMLVKKETQITKIKRAEINVHSSVQDFQLHIIVLADYNQLFSDDLSLGSSENSVDSSSSSISLEEDKNITGKSQTKSSGMDPFASWRNALDSVILSLFGSEYEGDKVSLTVVAWSNHETARSKMERHLEALPWIIGEKKIIVRRSLENLASSDIWWPQTVTDFAFFTSLQSRVMPGFYSYLKETVKGHLESSDSRSPSVYGIGLLPWWPKESEGTEFEYSRPSLRQEMGSDCQLVFGTPWQELVAHQKFAYLSPPPPPLGDKKPWRPMKVYQYNQVCEVSWQASMNSQMQKKRAFNLYAGFQNGNALCRYITEDPVALVQKERSESKETTSLGQESGGEEAVVKKGGGGNTKEGDATKAQEQTGEEEEAGEEEGMRRKLLQKEEEVVRKTDSHWLGKVPKVDICGKKIRKGNLAKNKEELEDLLSAIQVKKSVVAVMTSAGFDDMLENWLCFVIELGIENYFVISDSLEQATRLAARGHSAFYLHLPLNDKGSLDYGTIAYKEFILERTRMVQSILRSGYHVLLADVDAVWLSDPFLHMRSAKIDIYAQLEDKGYLCGGFLYLRATKRVVALWNQVTEMFERTVSKMRAEAPTKTAEEMPIWLKHYEHLHEQRYLNFLVTQKESSVVVKGLDQNLFPNGRHYFARQKPQKAGIKPVVIHNNYIVGKQNKTRRFKETGLWRLDSENKYCLCLSCRMKQSIDF